MIPLSEADNFIEITLKKPGLLECSSILLDLCPKYLSLLLVQIGIHYGENPTRSRPCITGIVTNWIISILISWEFHNI